MDSDKEEVEFYQNQRRGRYGVIIDGIEFLEDEKPTEGKWWKYDEKYVLELKQGKK